MQVNATSGLNVPVHNGTPNASTPAPKSAPQPQHTAPVGGGDSDGDSDGSGGGRVGTKLNVKA
jgi:hypothetical protein